MMRAEDVRECNKLEKNAKRMEEVVRLLALVQKSNEIADLDLGWMQTKAEAARDAMKAMRKKLIRS